MKKALRIICCAAALALLTSCGVLKSADVGQMPGLAEFTRSLAGQGCEVAISARKAEPHEVNVTLDFPAEMDSAEVLSVLLETMDFLQQKEAMRYLAKRDMPYTGFPGVYNIYAENREYAFHLGYSPAYGTDNGGAQRAAASQLSQ